MAFPYTPKTVKTKVKFKDLTTPLSADQIKNPDGAYVFKISPLQVLERFLVLGTCPKTKGTGISEELKSELVKVLKFSPKDSIELVESVSLGGKAPKNDQAIFVLALATSIEETRELALSAVNKVCRIPTHLFQFIEYVKLYRKLGRSVKRAIEHWYVSKDADSLAFITTKYKSREGWSHKDVFRLVHPKPKSKEQEAVLRYLANDSDIKAIKTENEVIRMNGLRETLRKDVYPGIKKYPALLDALEEVKTAEGFKLLKLIKEYSLAREHIPTIHLNNPDVWKALLPSMPMTGLIRNLAKLTSVGVIKDGITEDLKLIYTKLTDEEYIKKSKLHPMNIYLALAQYSKGHGDKGSLTWKPNAKIQEALEQAFYKSFNYIEPSGKNFSIGLDVSGSMRTKIMDMNISSHEAVTVMSMALLRSEPWVHTGMFTHHYQTLNLTKTMSLSDALAKTNRSDFGSTDIGSVIKYAIDNKQEVDVFTIMTDNDVNTGYHPTELLNDYRKKFKRPAKLLVFSTEAHVRSVCDPKDPYQLDVVGMSPDIPNTMSWFANF
jgi:60 kDa SS-A/Ro ribonucleoprotein